MTIASLLAVLPGSPVQAAGDPTVPTPTSRHLGTGRYIVTLSDAPVATYQGEVAGLPSTAATPNARTDVRSSDAGRYRDYLRDRHSRVAASVGATARTHYSVVTNGFTADLTGAQVARLSHQPGVLRVTPDGWNKVASDSTATDFLGLSGRRGLWSALGGTAKAGKGVVIGDIDTGIWPESASFAAPPIGTAPPTPKDPYRPQRKGDAITMRKADGGTFTGTCQTGDEFTASACNSKIVGARYFGEGWLSLVPPENRGDFVSPRDGNGHGTHTASTAAGDADVKVTEDGRDLGEISGVAPAASISVYKALWSSKDGKQDGGMTSDIVAAIDQAVADGVDVINYSVGSMIESGLDDPIQQAFRNAAAAGIFVSAAAGNSGPESATLDNTAPWVTTVAASTLAPIEATLKLGDGRTFVGGSTTVTGQVGPKPLVLAQNVKLASASDGDAALCMDATLDPAKATGTIVVCDRGVTARPTKSAEVQRAGGVGMVLVNTSDLDVDGDLHQVPTVHLNVPGATDVRTYSTTPGATAVLQPGGSSNTPYPQIAAFSSRGPSNANKGDLIKPDIAAPGVGILAAVAPPSNLGHNFDFLSGTSMATPQITGLAALYFGVHPTWSPMAVKSALMTTAVDTKTATGGVNTDPFTQGSGQVNPRRMMDPGLVYDSTNADWLAYEAGQGLDAGPTVRAVDPSDLNYPSIAVGQLLGSQTITRTVTATRPGIYRASAELPGIKVQVQPSTLLFTKAGQKARVKITLTQRAAPSAVPVVGSLTWTGSGHVSVRSPIVITPFSVLAPDRVAGSGAQGNVSFPVTPGSGKLTLTGHRPVAGPLVKGEISASNPEQYFSFTVPQGSKAGEFFVTTDNPDAALYLLIGRPINDQQFALVGLSEYAHRARVSAAQLPPGDYLAAVVDLGDAPGTSSTPYTIQSNVVGGGTAPAGTFSVTPKAPTTKQGVPITVTGSWSDVSTDRPATAYIEYPKGAGTLVSIGG
ncbi:S8 family serine peptidase [Micromonospora sp. CPCC 205539]|uniref:S8 family serine peptidase n=1 Tax=Micromonospora sp. CPCC 205539 TaxID=3122408 RepID=UPI002FEF8F77